MQYTNDATCKHYDNLGRTPTFLLLSCFVVFSDFIIGNRFQILKSYQAIHFLAVQDSSTGDLVTDSVSESCFDFRA